MDFLLNAAQQEARAQFRLFAESKVKPLAQGIDEREEFPVQTVKELGERGWLGLPFSREYGGQNKDSLTTILCIEELSKACASTGVIVSTHTFLCADTIYSQGSENQKSQFLKPLAQGKALGAFALTEPDSGTDLTHLKTTAEFTDGHFILRGGKIFITNAGYADTYIVFAATDPGLGTKGLSAFIVEKDFPGLRIGRMIRKMGIRGSSQHEIFFDNCVVPKSNLLGELNAGYKIALHTLDGGRTGIAAQALGIAQGAFDQTVAYTNKRIQFGRPITAFQNTQFKLASMKTRIEAARLLVYRAAAAKDTRNRFSEEAAMAKLFASETAMAVTTCCLQMHGGYGYTKDHPIERMMRDAKITEIYEGTSEVQKMVIAAYTIPQQ